jgi:hypothetical protein
MARRRLIARLCLIRANRRTGAPRGGHKNKQAAGSSAAKKREQRMS